MGAVTAKDIPEEQHMLTECWEFYKRNYHAEEGDAFWTSLVAEAKAIIAKYPGCKRLARNHLIAYIEEIEERWKKQHEKRE
ncbi:MAG: hypothetical protein HFI40_16060 [Lachnospiraceae bacterium]|jgi:predicted metal-dependent hydrolase|nr:hypothetical protein [Lachnospiraceae bacterium]